MQSMDTHIILVMHLTTPANDCQTPTSVLNWLSVSVHDHKKPCTVGWNDISEKSTCVLKVKCILIWNSKLKIIFAKKKMYVTVFTAIFICSKTTTKIWKQSMKYRNLQKHIVKQFCRFLFFFLFYRKRFRKNFWKMYKS